MRKYFFCTFMTLLLTGLAMPCAAQIEEEEPVDSVLEDSTAMVFEDSTAMAPSLNDIRFADFEDDDWLDNEYIRTVRKYIDAYNEGKEENEQLEVYKNDIKGKFVILNVEPFMFGGLLIQIIFIDNPENIFTAWVYSFVDEETRTISDYEVRMFALDETKFDMTKEQILELLKEHPEYKLW